jgi:hypothetical protein
MNSYDEPLYATDLRSAMRAFGLWIGPPRLVFLDATVDGRRRQDFFSALPAKARKAGIPTVRPQTKGDVAALLCHAGHHDRAREWIPDELTDVRDIAAWCHCAPELVAPLRRRKTRTQKRSEQLRVSTARRDTMEHVRRLLVDADRHSRDIRRDDLREVLRPWF